MHSALCHDVSVSPRQRLRRQRVRCQPTALSKDTSSLPSSFELQRVVLLATLSFEAYCDPPAGEGVLTEDAAGGSTLHLAGFEAERFSSALELQLLGADELAAGDLSGQSDPYVVCSVGENSWRSSTRNFTRNPVWNESCRLMTRRGVDTAVRLRVFDADFGKTDDTLGVAVLDLKNVGADWTDHVVDVQSGGAGLGGGRLRVRARVLPLSHSPAPPPPAWWRAPLDSLAVALPSALGRAADGAAPSQQGAGLLADDWRRLASASGALPLAAFTKIAFVAHAKTDTQVSLWRSVEHRTLAVAFRGTEQAKLADVLTDCRLVPRDYSPERAGWAQFGDANQPAVHDGFLSAFDSVRPRLLSALDDAIRASADVSADVSPDSAARDGPQLPPWRVLVTGHSLGGALATLCAAELAASRRRITVSLVNFGSPRMGNSAFARSFNALVPDSCRVVNGSDAVAALPSVLGYAHVAHGVRLSPAGVPRADADDAAAPQPAPAAADGGGLAGLWSALRGGGAADPSSAAAVSAVSKLGDASSLDDHMEVQYLAVLSAALAVTPATRGEA